MHLNVEKKKYRVRYFISWTLTRLTSGFVESIDEKNQQTCEAG
jgi:hypothetical protein